MGGAHKLLLSMCKVFPQADIYTSIGNPELQKSLEPRKVYDSFLNNRFIRKVIGSHYSIASPLAFESFTFDQYDIVFTLSAGPSKGIITHTRTKHINIILTPSRFQWRIDSPDYYTKNVRWRKLLAPFLFFLNPYSRIWDYRAARTADLTISISNFVNRLVEKLYKVKSKTIYPTVELGKVNLKVHRPFGSEPFYICISRLYPYKRIDIAIKACINLKKNLLIIGTGPEERALVKLAENYTNIKFLGLVDDATLYGYLKIAKALFFPGIEDFGIVMVESIISGTPVIAYHFGGASEIVTNRVNGLFFNQQTVSSLSKAITEYEALPLYVKKLSSSYSAKYSKKYSLEAFTENLKTL